MCLYNSTDGNSDITEIFIFRFFRKTSTKSTSEQKQPFNIEAPLNANI
jgi:hypothetical protein